MKSRRRGKYASACLLSYNRGTMRPYRFSGDPCAYRRSRRARIPPQNERNTIAHAYFYDFFDFFYFIFMFFFSIIRSQRGVANVFVASPRQFYHLVFSRSRSPARLLRERWLMEEEDAEVAAVCNINRAKNVLGVHRGLYILRFYRYSYITERERTSWTLLRERPWGGGNKKVTYREDPLGGGDSPGIRQPGSPLPLII